MVVKEDTWLCLTRIVNKHFIRNFTVEVSDFVKLQLNYYEEFQCYSCEKIVWTNDDRLYLIDDDR